VRLPSACIYMIDSALGKTVMVEATGGRDWSVTLAVTPPALASGIRPKHSGSGKTSLICGTLSADRSAWPQQAGEQPTTPARQIRQESFE
jgi:hypothetical protein